MNLDSISRGVGETLTKHGPEILIGLGITSMVTATIFGIKATTKATKLIEAKKQEVEREELTKIEVVKTVGLAYLPCAIATAVGVSCVIGASNVYLKRNAALATAYAVSSTALKEYVEKTKDVIGEKKEREIKDAIVREKVKRDPVSQKEVLVTNGGEDLCYDTLSGRYFRSSMDRLQKAVNEVNKQMLEMDFCCLNDLYYEIGLPEIALGSELGWNMNSGFVEFHFSSHLSDEGKPCIALDYVIHPKNLYRPR